jgi:hypothetical protein
MKIANNQKTRALNPRKKKGRLSMETAGVSTPPAQHETSHQDEAAAPEDETARTKNNTSVPRIRPLQGRQIPAPKNKAETPHFLAPQPRMSPIERP